MAAPSSHPSLETNDESEARLVLRAQTGDRAALVELFRRHAHPAWRLSLAVAGSTTIAEQSVAHGFPAALRRLQRRTTTLALPFRLQVARASVEAAAHAGRKEDAPIDAPPNDMVAAFRRLPERWRAALWLTAVEGGTPAQVAPILGLSVEGATALVGRAETGLRERYLRTGGRVFDRNDAVRQLRALVVPMSDTLELRTVARWHAWQDELSKQERHGLATIVPVTPWVERTVAGAAAAVFATGVACAVVLSSRPEHNAPQIAAPVSSGQLASGAVTQVPTSPFTPFTGTTGGTNVEATRTTRPSNVAGQVAAGVASAGGAVAANPTAGNAPGTAPGGATNDPTTDPATTPPPAATDGTGTGAGVGTNVGGTGVSVGAGTDGAGVDVGGVVVGTPPPPPAAGTVVTIDTGGLLPPVTIVLP